MKHRLLARLKRGMKNPVLRPLLSRVYKWALAHIMPCRTVIVYFWSWFGIDLFLRAYAIYITLYFRKVLLHGGDGVTMIGDLDDLDKPVAQQRGAKQMMLEQLRNAFEDMDDDGNGSLS